jgi:hypothetical protein
MGLFDIIGGVVNPILGEDTVARLPIVNGLLGAQPDSQKALLKKQEQLAAEAKKRAQQNAQMRMQALGQSMLAFNPQNQMMAQMFGPQAAFSPQQMAQMSSDPGAMGRDQYHKEWEKSLMSGQPMGVSADEIRRMEENERRMKQVRQQTTPLGPGPAPLRMPPPQAGRRY